MSYRQPDTAALEERDGHEERVAAILATIDAEEGLAERRRGRLRVAGVVVVGAALLGPILLVLGLAGGWTALLLPVIFGVLFGIIGHLGRQIPPRPEDAPPARTHVGMM
ncbi:MAG: hypothetical protein R3B72_00520 [Polyangiaceae bacterium]